MSFNVKAHIFIYSFYMYHVTKQSEYFAHDFSSSQDLKQDILSCQQAQLRQYQY